MFFSFFGADELIEAFKGVFECLTVFFFLELGIFGQSLGEHLGHELSHLGTSVAVADSKEVGLIV